MPDYYAILGVARDASAEDIKRAYRKLARESHPDTNQHDPHAEERFKQVSEAYQVLSDPEARQRYDTFGDTAGAAGGFGGFGDLNDIMDAFFGGSPFGRSTRARRRSAAVPGQDVGVGVSLSLLDVVTGTTVPIEIDSAEVCSRCSGDGCEPGTFRGSCSRCGGQGEIRASRQTILGTVMTSRPCTQCGGAGEAPAVPCNQCRGEGRVRGRRTVRVQVPPGVNDGMTLRLRGEGEPGVRGGADGDLFVRINIEPHDIFERDGDDLIGDLAISLSQAVLGAQIPVKTLDGEEEVRIDPGTQHGAIIRLKARGMPRLDGRGRGDLLVHVSVEIPRSLTSEERSLFERLAQLRGEDVGSDSRSLFRRMRDTFRQ